MSKSSHCSCQQQQHLTYYESPKIEEIEIQLSKREQIVLRQPLAHVLGKSVMVVKKDSGCILCWVKHATEALL